jgi:hypothetical protein
MGFYITVVSPVIFNYFIIPKIEKKLGHCIGYHPLLNGIFMGKWMCRQNEIAMYILNRYWAYLIRGDRGLPKFCDRFALKKAGYTIDMISRTEIFVSFLLMLSCMVTIICGIVVLITYRNVALH